MKKQACIILSILLLLAAALPCAGAEQAGAVVTATGLSDGRASIRISDISLGTDGIMLDIEYRNNGPEGKTYSDLFSLSVLQNDKELQRDITNPISRLTISELKDGESRDVILFYPVTDRETPVEVRAESLKNGSAGPLSVWFNPKTGAWGTKEESEQPPKSREKDSGEAWLCPVCDEVRTSAFCGVCGTPRTEEEAGPADGQESPEGTGKAGKTDGSIGSGPAPAPETFSAPLNAYIKVSDATNKNIQGGEQEIQITESGQYTLYLESTEPVHGLFFFGIQVKNLKGNLADQTNMTGRAIRVDEILVDGKPITFEKNVTMFCTLRNTYSKKPEEYYVQSFLYNGYYDKYTERRDNYYYWDGDTAPFSIHTVNPKDFKSFRTITVTFSYGRFEGTP